MKLKLFIFVIICLNGMFLNELKSQSAIINIIRWDNSEKKVEMDALRKLTFTADDLVLNYQAGLVENIAKAEIRKVVFGTSTSVKPLNLLNTIQVYPNPTREFITIKNIPDTPLQVVVYSITGSQVLNVQMNSSNQQINVSNLPNGLYYLKVNNQVIKFTKQ
jgi:hypothetical protein